MLGVTTDLTAKSTQKSVREAFTQESQVCKVEAELQRTISILQKGTSHHIDKQFVDR